MMSEHVSKEEADKLWADIREVLVKENIITSNGIGTNDSNEKLQKELRKLILVKSQTR